MENAPPNNLPGSHQISSISMDSISEVPAVDNDLCQVSRSLPASLNEDCSSSAEIQRFPTLFCPPLIPDAQIDSTVQELHYEAQTERAKILSNSQTKKIQPLGEGAGHAFITGTKKKQSFTLDYKSETATNAGLCEKEYKGVTVSSPSVPQSTFAFKVQDTTEHGVNRNALVQIKGSHKPLPDVTEQTTSHQDPQLSPLPLPTCEKSENKQTDISKTHPKIKELSQDAREIQETNSMESAETFDHGKELVNASHKERQPPTEKQSPKAGELHPALYTSGKGCLLSSSIASREELNTQRSCNLLEGEQGERSTTEEQTAIAATSSSDFPAVSECVTTERSTTASATPPLFDTKLVVSLHAEQVVTAEACKPSDHVLTTETPLTAEFVHSDNTQEIVVVREDAHISGDWSNVRLNQSCLLQRADGSVCEAAIVNELSSELSTVEPKLHEENVQANMELHSQPVEVYEFCGLVEEVAEETVCASSGAQIPHSPVYEVDLFSALLENNDEYSVKEDLDSQLAASIHTINEGTTVIISQQPLPSSHDANPTQTCSNSVSHNLSLQNTRVAAVDQHLVVDANQSVEVDHSGEVCLVKVATRTPDSLAAEQTDSSLQIVTPCMQVNAAVQNQKDVSLSPVIQTITQKQETEAVAGALSRISPVVAGETMGKESAVAVQNVAVPTEARAEPLCTTHSSGLTNPKLLLLKSEETPVLKLPSSLLTQVSKQQSVANRLANAHSSWSSTVSKECLPQTESAANSLCASVAFTDPKDPRQRPVSKTPVTDAPSQQSTTSGNVSLHSDRTTSVTSMFSTNKSDKEALTVTTTSHEEDPVSQEVGAPTDSTPDTLYMLSASVEREGTAVASPSPNDCISQPESYEDECEDLEQDDPLGEAEAQETNSGQVSSPEEVSDEEPDADKTESEMSVPSSRHKVRQWIAERVIANSSPASPSTSSYPGPSPTDWSTPRRERSSPLRDPHGKFVSPSSVSVYSSSSSPSDQATPQRPRGERHADMAELAKHEADIEHRTQALKREGFWSMKRLTRLTEPPRPKVHWDYLCEEMQWLSADFAQERRWKRGVARKVVRMVMRHHEELRQKEEKAKRDEHAKIRRVASSIAKEVRAFWSSVEKVVQYKQQSRLEEKRKKALDLQLDFIVGQTEKYSNLLSKSLAPSRPAETVPLTPKQSLPLSVDEDDRDFEPPCEEEDDEETIEVEEQQEGNDAESHQREIELLKEEGLLPLDQLLSTLKRPQDPGSDEECSDETSSSVEEEGEDGEFNANDEDAEDEEDTIDAQEKVEGNVDHTEELNDLAREGDMSFEELFEKYKGAYAPDFEAPSASASKESSDSEMSGDEEEETEEDESDAESNSSSSESPGDSVDDDDSDKDVDESEEEDGDDCGDEGMEVLLKEGDNSPSSSSSRPKKEISHIAATAESLQPKGYTLATTKVKTPIPFLLHGTLREYQHIGLDWLVTMYEKKLNGILADEMGLGKTIQTIALLAHLACEKGNWGPHLIIVPTSVMLNWEMEIKRWCPGFKILTYFGSQKERKLKRQGWTKPNAFHVCITSYKLVLQDHQAFRRKSWRYLILDEAQNIKNFKSQRWQSLLNFNSHRRLLLTGTPLQNSLMELWSLMHFLMPHVFQSHREFKEWFSNPLTGMIEGSQEYNEGLVKRLHKVLRPFLLRRIKVDVEKQMPKKYEHVVRCRLSKRQRFLYDDFMAQASTRETLASGHFMSVINILMQLRKVCNHPNLFDPRPIQSPFITQPIVFRTASLVQDTLEISPLKRCDLSMFDLIGLESRMSRYQADVFLPRYKVTRQLIQEISESPEPPPRPKPVRMKVNRMFQPPPKGDNRPVLLMNKPTCSVPPAAQTPKPAVPDVTSAPAVSTAGHQVENTSPPRPSMNLTTQAAVRASPPKPVLTVRPPTASCTASISAHSSPNPGNIMPQRVLLSPDMQARLPSGEVVSIAQLASLAGRPVSSCQGSKPVTFQLQGNKLTLSGAQIHQVPAASPRPVQGNVMHLVSSGSQHHLISQPAHVSVQSSTSPHPANPPTALPANRLPHSASSQATPPVVSSPGVVKIVVRQTAGKEGGPVPTLAVAPSPRATPQAPPSPYPHTNTTPIRNTAPLQISQRTPGPATAHYTIAPPGNPSSAPNLRPVLKVVQPPPLSTEQPAPVQVASSSSAPKSSAGSHDSNSSVTPVTTKPRTSSVAKLYPPPRKVPRPPPRSPFYMSWLADSLKQQRDGQLDFITRVNERHCGEKPMYGQEVLDFLTFLPGPRPKPATLSSHGEWDRSGQSSCLFAQWQNKYDYWFQSRAVREAIYSIEDRLELLSDVIDRFTFVIPPVEAPPISMHCCHPPPSLSHKQAAFCSVLSTQVAPLTRGLHHIQCYMRTQFPDLRLIQYDCGKLQTLHTLLRKLKTGGHRVLIFTQMTRMLDVLEQFLNYHGHIYLRLDGSTRVEQRQALMERFNADRRIFCFILSTRSGGVGVNLTGADTVVFYDSDWNPTMDAQAQDRCHRIGQTRDVHIYRLISERTVEENILKKANQKRMLGDMAIEGGNFTTAFFKQQTIRELFDMNDGEKREVAVELSVPQAEEEEAVNKQSTTILEQALCRAEDEEDIVAASQAKAEQVAELAEFNENIPLEEGGEQEEVEELSKAEQEIAALVEQLTPIERYAMNFLEASLEDVCKEELKQAEEQVEAARKGLDQAKEEGLKLHASSDDDEDDFLSPPASVEPAQPVPARRGRKPKDKTATSTRASGRLRGASPETEPDPREVPERPRCGLRGRGAKDAGNVSANPSCIDQHKISSSNRVQDSSRSSKASSPAKDHHATKSRTLSNRSHATSVPSPPAAPLPGGKQQCVGETDSKSSTAGREEKEKKEENERTVTESSVESSCPVDHQAKDDSKEHGVMSPPSTGFRSPRKRQSADGEVLRGLVEDSPSAKVLRKLPGRLVTVVEEKEPRRRRRRGSGTGGGVSSEETTVEDNTTGFVEETKQVNTSPSPDGKTKETITHSPEDQDSTPSPSVPPQPVRSYPPYSPPHLSPDMPVLRNLPVRRRLETESRMAAQLGEQLQHVGRGRGGNQSRKMDIPPGKDATPTPTESSVNSVVTPVKRKRGRPPKTPPRLPDLSKTVTTLPTSPVEAVNPTLSPKRKRGRPRKDSYIPESARDGQKSKTDTTTGVSDISKTHANTELTLPSPQKLETPVDANVTRGQGGDTKIDLPSSVQNAAQASSATKDQPSTPVSASVDSPSSTQVTEPLCTGTTPSAPAQSVSSFPDVVQRLDTSQSQVSSASSFTLTSDTPATTTTSPLPPASTVTATLPGVETKPGVSITSKAPVESNPSALKEETLSQTLSKPATNTPSAVSSSSVAVEEVPTSVPATSITPTTAVLTETSSFTPAVTTTVKSVSTKTTAVKESPQSSSPSFSTNSPSVPIFAPTTVTSPAAAMQKVSTADTSPSSASPKPTSKSSPTIAETVTSKSTCPNTFSTERETVSDTSSTPPLTDISPSPANTDPGAEVQSRDVTTTKDRVKPAAASQKTEGHETTQSKATTVSVAPISTPPATTASSAVTTTAKISVPTSTATEEVQLTSTEVTSSNDDMTSTPPSTSPEETVKIPLPVITSTGTTPAPLSSTSTTESSPVKSVAVTTTNNPTTSNTGPVSPAATTAASTKTVCTTQTSAAVSMQTQTSVSSDVSPDMFTPAKPESLSADPSSLPSGNQCSEQTEKASKCDLGQVSEMEVDATETDERGGKKNDNRKEDISKHQPKRRKVMSSTETKEFEFGSEDPDGETHSTTAVQKEEPEQQTVEQITEDENTAIQKRPLSRQSSQESTRSSSPSSGCSTSTLTRHAHHKRTYENRHPTKKRRTDITSDTGKEVKTEAGREKSEEGNGKEITTGSLQRRRSRSSSSSDSDHGVNRKENRLTRSSKHRQQVQEREKGNSLQARKRAHSSDGNASRNANTSTGGESGSDTSSVRLTRKSAGSQSSQGSISQTNTKPSLLPEPKVLGKRCSALNAAAKLLAMKGRVDTPGHTTRKEPGAKIAATSPTSSSDKNQKPNSKCVQASPQSNSVNITRNSNKLLTPNQTNRSASRSTRQCPGSLVPPLGRVHRRSKGDKMERGNKSSGGKEAEAESQVLSRGHSACSSMSSDGEGDCGGRSSRSRSSSNSSQRTLSISSQNTEHRESRATSSGSERSSERAKRVDKSEKQGQQRERRQERRRSKKLSQEMTSSSGTEGTPDRVLRSVAALAAVQARSPAASTRSSLGQHRHNKT
ncbi:helicase SRCAP [Antennarius striatus]|uniref:helicase SRCAP n=1 Tax=Antennarius striatus TaxID=241820 RepID=UPI0035B45D96